MKGVPLYQVIYDYYKERIINGVVSVHDQLPTEKELMDMFSVSRITAKNGINMLAEEGLVVRIPGKGTFVNKQGQMEFHQMERKKIIGLILCDIDYTFGMDLLKSVENHASDLGYQLIFKRSHESREKEILAIHEMIALGVEGIIIQTVHGELYSDEILRIYLSGFPMVFVDRHMDKTSIPFVSTHNYKATMDMTKKLVDAGYKNISFMSANPRGTTTLEQRYQGFKQVYRINDSTLDLLDLETPLTREKTDEQVLSDLNKMKQHLKEHPEIDCIFAAEMYVAKLAKAATKALGREVPESVGIVTFDSDTATSKYAYYTHIKQDESEMGKQAIYILKNILMRKQKSENRVFVEASIYQGKSTIKI